MVAAITNCSGCLQLDVVAGSQLIFKLNFDLGSCASENAEEDWPIQPPAYLSVALDERDFVYPGLLPGGVIMVLHIWICSGEAQEKVGIALDRQELDRQSRKEGLQASVCCWVDLIGEEFAILDNVYIFSRQEYVTWVIELGADSDGDGVVSGVSTDDRDEVGADVCLGGWIWAC